MCVRTSAWAVVLALWGGVFVPVFVPWSRPVAWATPPQPLQVAGILGDSAVLQRDQPIPIWGFAPPLAEVQVRFGEVTLSTHAKADGSWRVQLPPQAACEVGRDLVVASGSEIITRTDLLVGDVWVLAGQTNMAHPLSDCDDSRAVVRRADHPWLRCFFSADEAADHPARDCCAQSRWRTIAPTCAGDLSGVGYYFARELRRHTGTPIGLIQLAEPGAATECWASPQLIPMQSRLEPSLADYQAALAQLPERRAEWERLKAEHDRKSEAAIAAGLPVPSPCDRLRNGPMGPNHPLRPHALYLGRVQPIQPYAIKGVVWYEGEANATPERAAAYDRLLPAVLQEWRHGWERPDLPFVLVQLHRGNPGPPCDYATVREAQAHAAAQLGNCALTVTIDCGDTDEPFPTEKRSIGERVALSARRVAYRDLTAPLSPVVNSVRRDGNALIVQFRETHGDLELRGEKQGFEVKGAFGPFRSAVVEQIAPDTLRVSHPELLQPMVVRYAWGSAPAVSLYGGSGLPAGPFRHSVTR